MYPQHEKIEYFGTNRRKIFKDANQIIIPFKDHMSTTRSDKETNGVVSLAQTMDTQITQEN